MYSCAATRKPAVPAAGSWIVSPGWGLIQRTMLLIKGRGVKYCPAPDLVSLAFFPVSLHINPQAVFGRTEPFDLIEGFDHLL